MTTVNRISTVKKDLTSKTHMETPTHRSERTFFIMCYRCRQAMNRNCGESQSISIPVKLLVNRSHQKKGNDKKDEQS